MPFSKPNYTQVPNELFDELMQNLAGSELKILLLIIRKTLGFSLADGSRKKSDLVSVSQIKKYTGLESAQIIESLKKLENKYQLIQSIKSNGKTTIYSLWFSESEKVIKSEPFQKVKGTISESERVIDKTVSESENTKESNIKKLYKRKIRKLPQNIEEVKLYAKEHKITNIDIDFFWKYFTESGWIDSNGKKVYNWKQKFLTWSRMNFNKEKPFGKVIEK
jgi:hypothetical protein